MFASALELLRCRDCGSPFTAEGEEEAGEYGSGSLVCRGCQVRVPIVGGIPRFVPPENYASTFGFQWQRFAELQVDRLQESTMSRDRFYEQTGLAPRDLEGKRVLEAGCGGGRFSDIVLDAGAELFAIDLSNAVDKNRELHKGCRTLHLAQCSILEIPLQPESFDLVFCFGVLQHTPDPAGTFRSLVPFVKPGGRLAVDVYAAHPKQTLHWKYVLRPFTRRMDDERLLRSIERVTPGLMRVARALRRVPRAGKALTRLLPLKLHDGFMGRFPPEIEERWAVLETFDALSPAYDRPRSRRTLQRWLERAGFADVETFCMMHGLNYGRGDKPARG